MQSGNHQSSHDGWIRIHELSRGSLAIGLEDHESERLVQGFHCATGKDDLTGLRSCRQSFEVLRDNRIFGVRPRHLFLIPRRYLQDVNVLPTRLSLLGKGMPCGQDRDCDQRSKASSSQ